MGSTTKVTNMHFVAHTDHLKRTWLVGVDSNFPEKHIWVSSTPTNRGMGGRNMEFLLKGGGTITLQGPWHSNRHSFEQYIGIPIGEFSRVQPTSEKE